MKSLMLLLQEVVNDIGDWCQTSTLLDLKKIEERYEHEGLSFLTITLPNYCADFEKSLDNGYVDRQSFKGFTFKGGLPLFLGGFLDLVFYRDSGRLRDDYSIDAIIGIRQITRMYSKLQIECTRARNNAAIDKYIACEQDVKDADLRFNASVREDFSRISTLLWADVLSEVDFNVYNGNIVPKHGPGSTADGLIGNNKYYQKSWTKRLDQWFPFGEFLFSSYSIGLPYYNHVDILDPGAEIPVEVILVPKTLKTPRIIAREPTCMQYAQQAILEQIVESVNGHDIPRQLISWKHQEPNQELALLGSSNGELATLDLSEASDRVSNEHVRQLLIHFPSLAGAVDACRSRKALVPSGDIIRLAKFASMGSALCFPFEALVFTTVVFMGIERDLKRQITKKDVQSFLGSVRVYGDDIIVPVQFVSSVISSLESFGFKVNRSKSFWTGKFRESCGKEYFDGHDVSIVKLRKILPTSRKDAREINAFVEFRNHLYRAGYWKSIRWIDKQIERLIPFPAVLDTSPALGKVSCLGFSEDGTNSNLQSPFVKAAVLKSNLRRNSADDYAALMKFFLMRRDHLHNEESSTIIGSPAVDRNHLERSGRPVSVDIKIRKVSPL